MLSDKVHIEDRHQFEENRLQHAKPMQEVVLRVLYLVLVEVMDGTVDIQSNNNPDSPINKTHILGYDLYDMGTLEHKRS